MVRINPAYANDQQVAVIECLEDPDESMKVKSMELLYVMCRPANVEVCSVMNNVTMIIDF